MRAVCSSLCRGTIFGLNVGDAVYVVPARRWTPLTFVPVRTSQDCAYPISDRAAGGADPALKGLLVNAGNAAISQATLRSQVTTMVLAKTLGADDKKTPGTGQPSTGGTPAAPAAPSVSQPSPETVSDPATLYASQVVGLIKNIQTLLGDGKPVWADISSTSTDPKKKTKTGGEFTKFRLEKVKERMTEPTKPLSAQLLPIIDKAIKIMTTMLQVASSAQQNDDAFDKTERPATDALLEQAQALATAANLVLQQTGLPAKTFEPPPLQSSGAGAMSSAKTAVETAKYKVRSSPSPQTCPSELGLRTGGPDALAARGVEGLVREVVRRAAQEPGGHHQADRRGRHRPFALS